MTTPRGKSIRPGPTAGVAYRQGLKNITGTTEYSTQTHSGHTPLDGAPIDRLLHNNPRLWRGGDMAGQGLQGLSTGYPGLDAILPGQGWPSNGLVEVISKQFSNKQWGMGELQLLLPLMQSVSAQGKWVLLIAPPCQLYVSALVQADIDTKKVLVVKADTHCRDALWSMEKALQSSSCGLVLAWQDWLPGRVLRRLQLAGETGDTLGVLFKHHNSKHSPSPLRIQIKASSKRNSRFAEVTVIKAQGKAGTGE